MGSSKIKDQCQSQDHVTSAFKRYFLKKTTHSKHNLATQIARFGVYLCILQDL